jgi:hypothetical protein
LKHIIFEPCLPWDIGKIRKATERNDKIKRALTSISSGEYRTPYQAAKVLGLSEATLQWRIKGGKSRTEAHEAQQLLSRAEEKALEGWISRLTATGYPASYDFIQDMSEEVRKQQHHDEEHPHTYHPLAHRGSNNLLSAIHI